MNDTLNDWLMASKIHQVVCDHLGMAWPKTFLEYRTAVRRFGGRGIRLISRDILAEPCLRNKILYLPIPRNRAELKLWLCHELAHLVIEWEGEPELRYPTCWGDQEHFAHLIERIIAGEKRPHPEDWFRK